MRHLVCIDPEEGAMRRYEQTSDGKFAQTSAAPFPDLERPAMLEAVERFRKFPADYLRDLFHPPSPLIQLLSDKPDPWAWSADLGV